MITSFFSPALNIVPRNEPRKGKIAQLLLWNKKRVISPTSVQLSGKPRLGQSKGIWTPKDSPLLRGRLVYWSIFGGPVVMMMMRQVK